jgi:hypothetical protein
MENCADCGQAPWECSCPPVEVCKAHGEQQIVDAGEADGFTGATIYWATLECGCQWVDDSDDTLERMR